MCNITLFFLVDGQYQFSIDFFLNVFIGSLLEQLPLHKSYNYVDLFDGLGKWLCLMVVLAKDFHSQWNKNFDTTFW